MSVLSVGTPVLDIAYEASGPEGGRPVVLLHGWPDDVRTWDRVLPALHGAGLRTYAPWLRGYGPTRFLDASTQRSGQLAALGQDLLEFADALGLARFAVVGHDWGARAAYIASCLAPERIERSAALSVGWGTNDPDQVLGIQQIQNYWYHWYMATERGAELVRNDHLTYTRHIWTIWNPGWDVPDAEFKTTAAAFQNPDWAEITLHSYRHRWGWAAGDPRYADLEMRLAAAPQIHVPTLTIHGGADPVNAPSTSEGKEAFFKQGYERVVVPDAGHFPQRQASEAVADALVRFLTA
ncbi:alpha/beta fold hydrolase [Marinivivus vitaminiproducens]|uniref:alpha/beta fold hydrolase n=1 Tax=Marinivivus vitaminiproducens TaxID=3035935 RepID=UPI0027A9047A|nr:alpha/beta hydrolase [Geminicoccaceae bacterium SCSIO 64248]